MAGEKRDPLVGRRVRLALIGAGGMATGRHYPSLAERSDVEMAAICDLVPDKLKTAAEKFHIPRQFTDYRQMLDEVEPDAVYCIMPPHHMFDLCADILKRKLNLFVEKPLAVNAFQANSLARLAAENNCLTMVGFNRRFAPLVLRAKEELDKTGGLNLCRSVFHKRGSTAYYGGAIDCLACDAVHAVDLLRFMGGEVKSLEAAVSRFPLDGHCEVANSWIAVVRFESGAVGELSAHWASAARALHFEMHNDQVSAVSELAVRLSLRRHGDADEQVILAEELAGSDDSRIVTGFKGENDHFIECVKAGRQTTIDFSEAAKTAELVERIWRGTL